MSQWKQLQRRLVMMAVIGFHILAEFYGCDPSQLERVEGIQPVIEEALEAGNLTKLGEKYHQFEPYGATGIILLSESHLSIHTWPEHRYLAVDIFTCGPPENARNAYNALVKGFKPERADCFERNRGETP